MTNFAGISCLREPTSFPMCGTHRIVSFHVDFIESPSTPGPACMTLRSMRIRTRSDRNVSFATGDSTSVPRLIPPSSCLASGGGMVLERIVSTSTHAHAPCLQDVSRSALCGEWTLYQRRIGSARLQHNSTGRRERAGNQDRTTSHGWVVVVRPNCSDDCTSMLTGIGQLSVRLSVHYQAAICTGGSPNP